jgi:hypothetical protein
VTVSHDQQAAAAAAAVRVPGRHQAARPMHCCVPGLAGQQLLPHTGPDAPPAHTGSCLYHQQSVCFLAPSINPPTQASLCVGGHVMTAISQGCEHAHAHTHHTLQRQCPLGCASDSVIGIRVCRLARVHTTPSSVCTYNAMHGCWPLECGCLLYFGCGRGTAVQLRVPTCCLHAVPLRAPCMPAAPASAHETL